MLTSLKQSPFSSLNIPINICQSADVIYLNIKSEINIKDFINFSEIEVNDGATCFELSSHNDITFESSSTSKNTKNRNEIFKNFSTKKQINPWVKITFKKKIYIKELSICSRLNFKNNSLANLTISTFLKEEKTFTRKINDTESDKHDVKSYIKSIYTDDNLIKENIKFLDEYIKRLNLRSLYIRHFVIKECELSLDSNDLNRLNIHIAKLAFNTFDDLPEQVFKYVLITLIIHGKNKDDYNLIAKYANEMSINLVRYINKKIENFLPSQNNPIQITSHGLRRPKRTLKAIGSKNLIGFMSDIFLLFDKYNYDLIACYGTLLGIHRDNDFIPHDDDLDLLLITDNKNIISEIDQSLLTELESKNYEIKYKESSKNDRFMQIYPKHLSTHIDIFVGFVNEDEIILPMENVISRGIKKNIITPRKNTIFLDRTIYVPNRTESFLEERYGVNWHTPDIVFRFKEKKVVKEKFIDPKYSKVDKIKIALYNKILFFK